MTGERKFTVRKRTVTGPNAQEIEVEEIYDADRWAINHERISFQTDSRIPKSSNSMLQPLAESVRVVSNSVVGTRVGAEDMTVSHT